MRVHPELDNRQVLALLDLNICKAICKCMLQARGCKAKLPVVSTGNEHAVLLWQKQYVPVKMYMMVSMCLHHRLLGQCSSPALYTLRELEVCHAE